MTGSRGRLLALAVAGLMVGSGMTPNAGAAEEGGGVEAGTRYREPAVGSAGVVATVHPLASRAALDVLDEGGNAVDAAVAAVFAVGVVRPEMCGIGGGGFLVYRGANGELASLDFREKAPALHEQADVGDSRAVLYENSTGRNRVGVPGVVAGMASSLEKFGSKPLRRLVEPAEKLARDGFAVSPDLHLQMATHAHRLRLYPETAKTFLVGGIAPYPPGSTLVMPDYAQSLERIRLHGPKAFYRGRIAEAIAAEVQRGGEGFMSTEDLRKYEAVWREPLVGSYRGRQVITMGPPTSGGLVVLETLNILEALRLRPGTDRISGSGHNSADHLHYLAEAQKIAWADRNAYVADPDFRPRIPVDMMTSKLYASNRANGTARHPGIPHKAQGSYPKGDPATYDASVEEDAPTTTTAEGGHTTHVSVMDAAGNAVAVTCSLEEPFGSAVVAPGTGFVLNGQLGDFGEDPNHAVGGKRPRSSMSPTIMVEGGRPVLVAGAMGGATIPLAVVQTIVNMVDFGAPLALAVDAARADAQLCPDRDAPERTLCLEYARVAPNVQLELTQREHLLGYPYCAVHAINGIPRCDPEYHVYPEVQAVGLALTAHGEERQAVSDPRGECGAAAQGSRGESSDEVVSNFLANRCSPPSSGTSVASRVST